MTDRELLELAAKAAGIKIDKSPCNGGGIGNTGFDMLGNAVLDWHNDITWNPLTDDGDALWLAAKLRLNIAFPGSQGHPVWDAYDRAKEVDLSEVRRAIVQAAAEIGKAM